MKLQVFYNAPIINTSPYARKNEDQYILISRKNVSIIPLDNLMRSKNIKHSKII